ncbi:MAG: HD domain-containing phosphohydrolase [Desulfovibrio sp.]
MHKILIVDDDPNILKAMKRQLRKVFEVYTAEDAIKGIDAIIADGPFAVVISDYKMPKITGIKFLKEVQKITPNTSRILLTGFADIDIAISAVNEGQVFRLLTKPCDPKQLAGALKASLKQHELLTLEEDLLNKTLKGSIKVLTEILSLIQPDTYGKISRILPYVKGISKVLNDKHPWRTESAAMLSLLGYVLVPPDIIEKVQHGKPLDAEERRKYNVHSVWCAELISNIPRMDEVSDIIKYQDKLYDGSGPPKDKIKGIDIPFGARVLKVVNDFDTFIDTGMDKPNAYLALKRRLGWYDTAVLNALELILGDEAKYRIRKVDVYDLREGMILAEDVTMMHGGKKVKIIGKGQVVSDVTIGYLKRYTRFTEVEDKFKIVEELGTLDEDEATDFFKTESAL